MIVKAGRAKMLENALKNVSIDKVEISSNNNLTEATTTSLTDVNVILYKNTNINVNNIDTDLSDIDSDDEIEEGFNYRAVYDNGDPYIDLVISLNRNTTVNKSGNTNYNSSNFTIGSIGVWASDDGKAISNPTKTYFLLTRIVFQELTKSANDIKVFRYKIYF